MNGKTVCTRCKCSDERVTPVTCQHVTETDCRRALLAKVERLEATLADQEEECTRLREAKTDGLERALLKGKQRIELLKGKQRIELLEAFVAALYR